MVWDRQIGHYGNARYYNRHAAAAAGIQMAYRGVRALAARRGGYTAGVRGYARQAFNYMNSAAGIYAGRPYRQQRSGRPPPGHGVRARITYVKPPRVRLAKQRGRMRKGDLKKLRRMQVKFPIPASVKVILGESQSITSTSTPLGPQWTRGTTVAKPTGYAANTHLCGFVVPLTKLTNLKVGQGNISINTAGPTGGYYTQDNLLFSIKSDSSQMIGEDHNYQCTGLRAQTDSDYLVSGVSGSIQLHGMQQSCDQVVTVGIYRVFNKPCEVDKIEEQHMKELVNAQTGPNNQSFTPLYITKRRFKGRGAGSARISTQRVKFDLPLNLKRSKTKKVSTAADATSYGTQLSYAYEQSGQMFNTLFMVITSRSLNTTNQEAIDDLTASKATPGIDDGGGRMDPRIGIQGHVTTHYRYRNSQVEPGATSLSAETPFTDNQLEYLSNLFTDHDEDTEAHDTE